MDDTINQMCQRISLKLKRRLVNGRSYRMILNWKGSDSMHHRDKVYRHPVLCRVLIQITIIPTFTDGIRLKSQTTQCFFRKAEKELHCKFIISSLESRFSYTDYFINFFFQASEGSLFLHGVYTTRSHCWCT